MTTRYSIRRSSTTRASSTSAREPCRIPTLRGPRSSCRGRSLAAAHPRRCCTTTRINMSCRRICPSIGGATSSAPACAIVSSATALIHAPATTANTSFPISLLIRPAPRLGFAWAIGRKTSKIPILTLRGGAGLFYQRLTAADLLLPVGQNGISQIAYFVKSPKFYPAVPPSSSLTAAEPTIYRVDPRLKTSHTLVSSITAERIIGHIGNIAVNYLEANGRRAYLLLNANAPLPGTYNPDDPNSGLRPFGGTQNIYQYTAEGTGHAQMFFTNLNLNPTRRLYLFAFYVAQRDHSDANGTSSFASNPYNIRQDYGRDDSDNGQSFYTGAAVNLPDGFTVQPFISARS